MPSPRVSRMTSFKTKSVVLMMDFELPINKRHNKHWFLFISCSTVRRLTVNKAFLILNNAVFCNIYCYCLSSDQHWSGMYYNRLLTHRSTELINRIEEWMLIHTSSSMKLVGRNNKPSEQMPHLGACWPAPLLLGQLLQTNWRLHPALAC